MQRSNEKCSRCVWLTWCSITSGLAIGLVFGLILVRDDVGFNDETTSFVDSNTDLWKDSENVGSSRDDHKHSSPRTKKVRWPNTNQGGKKNGLSLTILNAMDDSWQVDLGVAVEHWNAGSSSGIDPLTLNMEMSTPDMACSPVEGTLKICNGNYGPTGWRGVNDLVVNKFTKEIISSSARINEYYLDESSSSAQRLYTLCHELGHGFGLPDWDQDHHNKDMRNCMDYSVNVETSQRPDESNFIYLKELYGSNSASALRPRMSNDEPDDDSLGNDESSTTRSTPNNGGGRQRRHLRSSRTATAPPQGLSSTDAKKSSIMLVHPQDAGDNHGESSRLLVANDHTQLHYYESKSDPDVAHVYQYLLVA